MFRCCDEHVGGRYLPLAWCCSCVQIAVVLDAHRIATTSRSVVLEFDGQFRGGLEPVKDRPSCVHCLNGWVTRAHGTDDYYVKKNRKNYMCPRVRTRAHMGSTRAHTWLIRWITQSSVGFTKSFVGRHKYFFSLALFLLHHIDVCPSNWVAIWCESKRLTVCRSTKITTYWK